MLSRSFNKRSFFLKVAFLFSDVSDPRLTQHVSCFDEKNSAEDEKSCFHIRFDKPCGYEEKFKRLHLYVCQTFGNQFVLFIYFCIYFFFIYLFIFFFFFLLTTLLVQKIQNLIKPARFFFVLVYVPTCQR